MPKVLKEKTKRKPPNYSLRIRCEHRDLNAEASTSTSNKRSKSRSQNWRDKLKIDNPIKYQQNLVREKKNSTYYRLQCATAEATLLKRNLTPNEQAEAEIWLERKKRSNEAARLRMKKMNDKKKSKKTANPNPEKKQKVETRKQTEKRKGKATAKKARERAGYTKERKQEVNAKRRELYAKKKEKANSNILEEKRRKLKEKEDILNAQREQLRMKEAELQKKIQDLSKGNDSLPEESQFDLRSKGARNQALKRLKKNLPKRRLYEISTRVDFNKDVSPAKQAQLIKAGLPGPSSDPLNESITEAVTTAMTKPVSGKRKLLASILQENLKDSKKIRSAAKKFKCSRKLLTKAKLKAIGRKRIRLETIQLIQAFYEENSSPLPDKKLVSKKTQKPRHIMRCTISQLYSQYQKTHPDHKVSSGVFFAHRPRHVRTRSQAKYIGCLCEYCENIFLKIKVLNQLQPGGIFKDEYSLVSATMCQKSVGARFHNPACIKRQCKDCGIQKLNNILEPLLHTPTQQITWTRWEVVTTPYFGKQGRKDVKKRKPVLKQDTIVEMLAELMTETEPHAEHLFNKDWQNSQEATLIGKLRADEVLGVYDFAENFKCGHQREVQSAYYAQDSATVHPVVTYYNCNVCLKSVRESLILVSDDLIHDYNLVNAFQKVVSNHLMTARELKLSTFYRFSDGCSSQYKSKGPISDISYSRQDFGYTIHHNYSGTRHGKGASDGESGVVKRLASDAIKAGTAVISTSQQLYKFLAENVTKEAEDGCCIPFRRSVFFVKHDDVQRERQDRAVKTVAGTRSLHSIKCVTGGQVGVRNLSCFCDACRGCGGIICQNVLYVQPWKVVKLANGRGKYELFSQFKKNTYCFPTQKIVSFVITSNLFFTKIYVSVKEYCMDITSHLVFTPYFSGGDSERKVENTDSKLSY